MRRSRWKKKRFLVARPGHSVSSRATGRGPKPSSSKILHPLPKHGRGLPQAPEPRTPQGPQPPNVGARTTRPSPTSSPTRQNALNDRTRPALDLRLSRPPSQRKKHPRPSPNRGFQRGPRPPLVVLRWVWEGNRNPSQNFSSGVWGCILSIRKEYIPRCRQASLAPPAGRPAPTGGGSLSPRQKADSPPLRAPPEYPPPPAYSPSPPAPSGPGR